MYKSTQSIVDKNLTSTKFSPNVSKIPNTTHPFCVVLNGCIYTANWQRSKRKTLSFGILPNQTLLIRASQSILWLQIEQALQHKALAITKAFERLATRQSQQTVLQADWKNGMFFDHLGEKIQLICGKTDAVCHLPDTASPDDMRKSVVDWLQAQAVVHYTQRLNHFALQMNLPIQWHGLRLTNAKTKWGSAKKNGQITLHLRLMQLPPELLDYVVVHELSHLQEFNHSPAFWKKVAGVLPNYQMLVKSLKHVTLHPF